MDNNQLQYNQLSISHGLFFKCKSLCIMTSRSKIFQRIMIFCTHIPYIRRLFSIERCEVRQSTPKILTNAQSRMVIEAGNATLALIEMLEILEENKGLTDLCENDVKTSVDSEKCIACYDNRKQIISKNCGHLCVCLECSDRISSSTRKCPVCREEWVNLMKIYF